MKARRQATDTITEYYQVEPSQIGYLAFMIHSYEGIAVVRTLDRKAGIIEILISPDFLDDLHALINAFRKEIRITCCPGSPGQDAPHR